MNNAFFVAYYNNSNLGEKDPIIFLGYTLILNGAVIINGNASLRILVICKTVKCWMLAAAVAITCGEC